MSINKSKVNQKSFEQGALWPLLLPLSSVLDFSRWDEFADILKKELKLDNNLRIDNLYLPLFYWLIYQVEQSKKHPLMIGLNGPQGCGKTTLTSALAPLFKYVGLKSTVLSIDDFYLTREEQIQLAKRYLDNPYLKQRGYPGTHDIFLGRDVLEKLANLKNGESTYVPVYDKYLHSGQGDRLPMDKWRLIKGRQDIIILDGWMLGFQPVPEKTIQDQNLMMPNRFLTEYFIWQKHLQVFIQLVPLEYNYVLKWRVEAEARARASGKSGMSQEQIEKYISKFLPAYELWGSRLERDFKINGPNLSIQIGFDRLPKSFNSIHS